MTSALMSTVDFYTLPVVQFEGTHDLCQAIDLPLGQVEFTYPHVVRISGTQ